MFVMLVDSVWYWSHAYNTRLTVFAVGEVPGYIDAGCCGRGGGEGIDLSLLFRPLIVVGVHHGNDECVDASC